jgi:hypothetical protein
VPFGGLLICAVPIGPHAGPQIVPNFGEHWRALAVKLASFLADFRGFCNLSRTFANYEMVRLRDAHTECNALYS